MITIEGGCHRCNMLTHNDKEVYEDNQNKLICQICYDKYYSEVAIRNDKLKKLLKKSIWQKIKNIFKKNQNP